MITLFANHAEVEAHRASLGILLSDGLHSCLAAAQHLAELPFAAEPDALTDDIAAQLAAERAHVDYMRSREELLLARLERTRLLALELRAQEACLRPELDLFRLATHWVGDALAATRPDLATQFDTANPTRRYLGLRRPEGNAHVVAGMMPVDALVETLFTVLDALEPMLPDPPAVAKACPLAKASGTDSAAGAIAATGELDAALRETLELSMPVATDAEAAATDDGEPAAAIKPMPEAEAGTAAPQEAAQADDASPATTDAAA